MIAACNLEKGLASTQCILLSVGRVCLAMVALGNSIPAHGEPLRLYSVGNSLTVDLRASGGVEALSAREPHSILHDYHVRCGSSLTAIVQDIQTTCVASLRFGNFSQVFSSSATTRMDVVTLQPFYGATIRQEIMAANTLLATIRGSPAGRNSRIMIYATWPSQSDGPLADAWARQDLTLDSQFRPSRLAYELLLSSLLQSEPAVELIPAGHAWVEIAEQSSNVGTFAGVPGASALYRDAIHASNLGRYVAGLATYSALFKKSPEGLGAGWMYDLNGYETAPQAADLQALQRATWGTTVTVPEPSPLGLILACVAVLIAWRPFGGSPGAADHSKLRLMPELPVHGTMVGAHVP